MLEVDVLGGSLEARGRGDGDFFYNDITCELLLMGGVLVGKGLFLFEEGG